MEAVMAMVMMRMVMMTVVMQGILTILHSLLMIGCSLTRVMLLHPHRDEGHRG